MAPGSTLFRFTPHFGENVLPHGSHEWLPYSKNEVRLKSSNNNLPSCWGSRIGTFYFPAGELSTTGEENVGFSGCGAGANGVKGP